MLIFFQVGWCFCLFCIIPSIIFDCLVVCIIKVVCIINVNCFYFIVYFMPFVCLFILRLFNSILVNIQAGSFQAISPCKSQCQTPFLSFQLYTFNTTHETEKYVHNRTFCNLHPYTKYTFSVSIQPIGDQAGFLSDPRQTEVQTYSESKWNYSQFNKFKHFYYYRIMMKARIKLSWLLKLTSCNDTLVRTFLACLLRRKI